MLLSLNFQSALDYLDSPRMIRDDIIIPSRIPEHINSPYRPGYDWLYRYERDIASFLSPWLKDFRFELIGEKGLLCEALSNAFSHGHNKDPQRPIFVKVFLGKRGLMLQIKDIGIGFDVCGVLTCYFKKQKYFYTAGNGLHLMATSRNFGIFYNPSGNTFHLLHTFHMEMSAFEITTLNQIPNQCPSIDSHLFIGTNLHF